MSDDKAEHVRKQIKADKRADHHCHWPGCNRTVPAACWGCGFHWRKLPQRLRMKIWDSYRIGQEETKTPSREYVKVAQEVQDWIRENYDVEE